MCCNNENDKYKDCDLEKCCNENEVKVSSKPVVDCTFIGILQNAWVVTKFALIDVESGAVLYRTGSYRVSTYCKIDLISLSLATGTEFYLKAEVEGGSDSIGPDIIRYDIDGHWGLYELTGTTFNTDLHYM